MDSAIAYFFGPPCIMYDEVVAQCIEMLRDDIGLIFAVVFCCIKHSYRYS